MRDLIKSALIRAAIAAVVTAGFGAITGLRGEAQYSIEGAAATANPSCAPHPVKMRCLQNHAYTG